MFNLVQTAYAHHQLLVAPAAPFAFAPNDAVLAAYPPLQHHMFYAMNAIGGPALNCAQSAILLARTRTFLDKMELAVKNNSPPPPPMPPAELAPAGRGFTVLQMIRFLSHNGLKKFPVYEYNRVTDTFVLLSGTPREDQNAIVFVPSDPPALVLAHWTYGGVDHLEEPAIEPVPTKPYVVYSTYYVDHPLLYWRARVVAANRDLYQRSLQQGRACDCAWDWRCQHEQAFVAANPGAERVTLGCTVHVEGTHRATILGHTAPAYPTVRVAVDTVRQRLSHGHYIRESGSAPGASILLKASLQNYFHRLLHNTDYAELVEVGTEMMPPLKVHLQTIAAPDRACDTELGNVAKIALLKLVEQGPVQGNYVEPYKVTYPDVVWAHDLDLTIRLPRRNELLRRLAARGELTKDSVLDTLRRMCAEEKWDVDFTREDIQLWVSRVTTEVGMATPVEPGVCLNCTRKIRTYRRMCKECRRMSRAVPPEPLPTTDVLVTYAGRRPLWAHAFEIPTVTLKPDCEVHLVEGRNKRRLYPGTTFEHLVSLFKRDVAARTQRGYSSGPIFLSQEPSCYPRGAGTACLAFLVRLGVSRKHQADRRIFDLAFRLLEKHGIDELEPETRIQYVAHQRGDKKRKNQDAADEVGNGWLEPQDARGKVAVKMTGFPKAEKCMAYTWDPTPCTIYKDRTKPRFICSPNPMMLLMIGRYTHPQTKWLAKKFPWTENLYYAGCSTPEELNLWLNRTLRDNPEPYSIVDDITAMDSNHSRESFAFHRRVRQLQYPKIDAYMAAAFDGEEELVIRVGNYRLVVKYVNASGVTDTSYKNSLMCLMIRAIATLHAFRPIDLNDPSCLDDLIEMLKVVAIAASGDDGLTRVPAVVLGTPIEQFSIERYREAWAWSGFEVKVSVLPPTRWRMATFLAMRPVWAGTRYEWAPEPARRLRGMFWQIDNTMHHGAWSRGIATQVLGQSKHLPVLSDLCEWFLRITTGPVATHPHKLLGNEHSPFYNYQTTGERNDRALSEFLMDYRLDRECYEAFVRLLQSLTTPYVCFSGHIFHRIFEEES